MNQKQYVLTYVTPYYTNLAHSTGELRYCHEYHQFVGTLDECEQVLDYARTYEYVRESSIEEKLD